MSLALVAEGSSEKVTLAPPFAARVPIGRYRLEADSTDKVSPTGAVDVREGGVARFDVAIEPPAALEVRCTGAAGGARDFSKSPCVLPFMGS